MNVFNEIIQLMLDLTDEQLEKVRAFILTKLKIIVNPISVEIRKCPYCNGLHIVKNGKNKGKQRFFCKDCNRNFVSTTNSIAANSRFSNETWINYVDCMLSGLSVRHTAYICGIDYKTAFYWRHKIIGSLKEVLDDKLSLQGIIEADETFFPISYKGNHSKDGFIMPRKPHKRGEKAKKRGISREKVCVSCMIDQNKNIQSEIAGLGRITTEQLEKLNKIEPNSILVTDKALAYIKFANNNGFELIRLKAGKEYKRGIYHLGHINSFHSTLKRFMRGFNGVSTKHLPNYLNWHIWLVKTAEMIRNTRVDDMLEQAIQHPFVITDKQIHQKVALPIAA